MEIKDEKLNPYHIKQNDANYDVVECTGKSDKSGKPIEKIHGHFSNVEGALGKIIKLKVERPELSYSLKEYINELKTVKSIVLG